MPYIHPDTTGSMDLRYPRQEKFARLLAAGLPADTAYVQAGFNANSGNARRLRSTAVMKRRVSFLVREHAKTATLPEAKIAEAYAYKKIDALREADKAIALAEKKEDAKAIVAAVALKAKILGLIVEKREVREIQSIEDLSDEELERIVKEFAARRQAGEA